MSYLRSFLGTTWCDKTSTVTECAEMYLYDINSKQFESLGYYPDPYELIMESPYLDCILVDELLDCLSSRQRKVIGLFFGLEGMPGMTCEEIAAAFKCSCEEIKYIILKAIRTMGKCYDYSSFYTSIKLRHSFTDYYRDRYKYKPKGNKLNGII